MTIPITRAMAQRFLPDRPDRATIEEFGKALIVAGSPGRPGSAVLATTAAARVGAGTVVLAAGRSMLSAAGRPPEIAIDVLPEADFGYLGEAAAVELLRRVVGHQALLVGCGIGRDDSNRLFLRRLFDLDTPAVEPSIGFAVHAPCPQYAPPRLPPVVIDGDALTLIARTTRWWRHLPARTCILTPHPGEMRGLLAVDRLTGDPAAIAAEASTRWDQIVVLKGALTAVAEPAGECRVLEAPNPSLATSGTGDVLAGIITGLLAQGLERIQAAILGVYIHSLAGAMVREDLGVAGTMAGDLLPRLPLVLRGLAQSRSRSRPSGRGKRRSAT